MYTNHIFCLGFKKVLDIITLESLFQRSCKSLTNMKRPYRENFLLSGSKKKFSRI